MAKTETYNKIFEELWAIELRRIYTEKQQANMVLSVAKQLFLVEAYNRQLAGC